MRHYLSATVLMLAAACGNARGGSVTYRLVHADGAKPPIMLRNEGGCQHLLLGAEVVFPGDRTYTSMFNIHRACADSTSRLPDIGTSGRVSFSGDTVFFHDPGGNITGRGRITADSLTVQSALRRLVYGRVAK